MLRVIVACAALALAAPAFAQQAGTGSNTPTTPGSSIGSQPEQSQSGSSLQEPDAMPDLLPNPGAGLSEPVTDQSLGSGGRASEGQGGIGEQGTAQGTDGLAGGQVDVSVREVRIAGPGDVVRPVTRDEEDVSTVLRRSRARR